MVDRPRGPGISRSLIFWSLLILLIAACCGVVYSWSNQRRLVASRTEVFNALVAIREFRDHVQTACHQRIIGALVGTPRPAPVLDELGADLTRIEDAHRSDPDVQPLSETLRGQLDAFAAAVTSTTPGPDLAASGESRLRQVTDTLAAMRERLLARFEGLNRQTYEGAVTLQVSMLAVLVLALVGMGVGAMLARRENLRRDKFENELRASEQKLERAEQIARIGYWTNDRAAETVSGSAEYFRIHGLPPADRVPVQAIFDLLHPDDVARILDLHAELAKDATPRTIEYRIVVGGEVRHMIANIIVETDTRGALVKTFGTVQDVTLQRRAEADALAWRNRFEAAVRAARQMVYERDTAGGTMVWEGACRETLGVDGADIATFDGWTSRIHADDMPAFRAALAHSMRSGTPFALEYRVRHADGRYISILDRSHVMPAEVASGKVIGLILDMSDRKRLESELLQAQKLESIGRLAGGVAHDLNNWLTAILGYVGLARIDQRPTHLADYLDRIERAGNSAAQMTAQLLAFARRRVIEPKVCTLEGIVRESASLLKPLLREDIRLHVAASPGLWNVHVDPGQFEQIVVNLAINARDAMQGGGAITIEIRNVVLDEEYSRTHPEVTPGEYVLLAVSDTGEGIPQDQLGRIFEPFYTTKPRGEGTGLGLATVLGLVKQHGGHIWVYSEVGKGTTFKIYVPRYTGDTSPGPRRGSWTATTGSESVLVVEDETLVRELAVAALRERGYRVIEALSAEYALDVIRDRITRIDIVVTDVIMPGASGKQIADAVRQHREGTRILFTSGYTDNVIVNHGILEGGMHFLQKPYTPALLTTKVRQVLDGAPPSAESEIPARQDPAC